MSSNRQLYRATTLIREKLLGAVELVSRLGGKIYPCVANDGTNGDFIVVRRKDYDRSSTKQGVYDNKVLVEVLIVSEHYDRGIEITEIVDEILEGGEFYTLDDELNLTLNYASEEYDDGKYIQVLEYSLN